MKELRLDERLTACANFVREGKTVADIGTDHGYLPTYLLLNKKIKGAIACDINEKPLEKAKETAHKYGVYEMISFRLCNGLEKVEEFEFDDLVIAGMGGELIASIISSCDYIKNENYNLILQPMSKAEVLRKFLSENGFEILFEKAVISNGKINTVINAVFTGKSILKDDYFNYLGKLENQFDKPAVAYKEKLKNSLIKKAEGILSSDKDNANAKELLKIAKKIKTKE